MAKKPDFLVYGRTLASGGEHWKKIGVAWSNVAKDKNKTSYVRIALDFMPITGELTLWKVSDRKNDLEPNDMVLEEKPDGETKA